MKLPKKPADRAESVETKIARNQWWPFDRVDGKILQRMHRRIEREKRMTNQEDALL
jgi:hypothetical protein